MPASVSHTFVTEAGQAVWVIVRNDHRSRPGRPLEITGGRGQGGPRYPRYPGVCVSATGQGVGESAGLNRRDAHPFPMRTVTFPFCLAVTVKIPRGGMLGSSGIVMGA